MPDLKSCDQCSQPLPVDAPGGLCPTCLVRLGPGNTPPPTETPRPPHPGPPARRQPEHPNATTAELARQPDTTGTFRPLPGALRAGPGAGPRQAPAVLGNLEVFEEIGHGGMGVVYRAKQRLANREVAVKVLPGTLAARGGAAERFSGE